MSQIFQIKWGQENENQYIFSDIYYHFISEKRKVFDKIVWFSCHEIYCILSHDLIEIKFIYIVIYCQKSIPKKHIWKGMPSELQNSSAIYMSRMEQQQQNSNWISRPMTMKMVNLLSKLKFSFSSIVQEF